MDEDGLTGMGVAAALSARYAADQRDFAAFLAPLLEAALPDATEVERRGGLFGPKEVRTIRVRLGDTLYVLEVPARGAVAASRARVVRGIRLRTEPMPTQEWVAALGEHLAEHAERSQETSDALRALMGG